MIIPFPSVGLRVKPVPGRPLLLVEPWLAQYMEFIVRSGLCYPRLLLVPLRLPNTRARR
jgi:hypothetical protein